MAEEEKRRGVTIGVASKDHDFLKAWAAQHGLTLKGLITELARMEGVKANDGVRTVGDYLSWGRFFTPGVDKRQWALEAQQRWMLNARPNDLAQSLGLREMEDFKRKVEEAIRLLRGG